MVEQAQQRRVLGVLGPVVHEEQRQRLGRIGVDRRPQERRNGEAGEGELSKLSPVGVIVGDPGGRLVARELDDRFRAERAGCVVLVGGIGDPLLAAVTVLEDELVLEPVDGRPGEAELPSAAVPVERHDPRPGQLVRQRHAAELALGIGETELRCGVRDRCAHRGRVSRVRTRAG
jgi:hypothetical protein